MSIHQALLAQSRDIGFEIVDTHSKNTDGATVTLNNLLRNDLLFVCAGDDNSSGTNSAINGFTNFIRGNANSIGYFQAYRIHNSSSTSHTFSFAGTVPDYYVAFAVRFAGQPSDLDITFKTSYSPSSNITPTHNNEVVALEAGDFVLLTAWQDDDNTPVNGPTDSTDIADDGSTSNGSIGTAYKNITTSGNYSWGSWSTSGTDRTITTITTISAPKPTLSSTVLTDEQLANPIFNPASFTFTGLTGVTNKDLVVFVYQGEDNSNTNTTVDNGTISVSGNNNGAYAIAHSIGNHTSGISGVSARCGMFTVAGSELVGDTSTTVSLSLGTYNWARAKVWVFVIENGSYLVKKRSDSDTVITNGSDDLSIFFSSISDDQFGFVSGYFSTNNGHTFSSSSNITNSYSWTNPSSDGSGLCGTITGTNATNLIITLERNFFGNNQGDAMFGFVLG